MLTETQKELNISNRKAFEKLETYKKAEKTYALMIEDIKFMINEIGPVSLLEIDFVSPTEIEVVGYHYSNNLSIKHICGRYHYSEELSYLLKSEGWDDTSPNNFCEMRLPI